ncbi:MAG: riboflavin synthase [Phycisphaerae bacterium]|nr:riboflavin synthase [Phycisphaerae bacterium]
MFTGLVQAVGRVEACQENSDGGVRLDLTTPAWADRPSPGDSIAIDGCCLTVVDSTAVGEDQFRLSFDVVQQTLQKTTLGGFGPGRRVNLERAATPETLLGGHLVQGHVDSLAEVVQVQESPGNVRLHLRVVADVAELIVPQGSITIDGVSLTVADVAGDRFQVALIPKTLEWTNLSDRSVGDRVNIESDILLRSVRQLMAARGILPAVDS